MLQENVKETIENCHGQLHSYVALSMSIKEIFGLTDSLLNCIISFIESFKEDLLSNIWDGKCFVQPLEYSLTVPEKNVLRLTDITSPLVTGQSR